jgi:hypothetical protein
MIVAKGFTGKLRSSVKTKNTRVCESRCRTLSLSFGAGQNMTQKVPLTAMTNVALELSNSYANRKRHSMRINDEAVSRRSWTHSVARQTCCQIFTGCKGSVIHAVGSCATQTQTLISSSLTQGCWTPEGRASLGPLMVPITAPCRFGSFSGLPSAIPVLANVRAPDP